MVGDSRVGAWRHCKIGRQASVTLVILVWALYLALDAGGDDPDLPDRAMAREIMNVSSVHMEQAKVHWRHRTRTAAEPLR